MVGGRLLARQCLRVYQARSISRAVGGGCVGQQQLWIRVLRTPVSENYPTHDIPRVAKKDAFTELCMHSAVMSA